MEAPMGRHESRWSWLYALVFSAALGTLVFNVSGRSWSTVTGDAKADLFVDRSSIHPEGPYMLAWFRLKYREFQVDAVTGRRYKGMRQQLVVDCRQRSFAVKRMAVYVVPGERTPLSSHSYPDAALLFKRFQGRFGAAMAEAACLQPHANGAAKAADGVG
jgi:hypothetical protein